MLFKLYVIEVIFIFFFAYLAIICVGSCYLDIIMISCLFSFEMHFQISFNFFFELKSLEGLVLQEVFLYYMAKYTLSTGRRKAGVKKSRSLLKQGMIVFGFPYDLRSIVLTFPCHGSSVLPSKVSTLCLC